jgi:hypothetical protein
MSCDHVHMLICEANVVFPWPWQPANPWPGFQAQQKRILGEHLLKFHAETILLYHAGPTSVKKHVHMNIYEVNVL